MPLEDNCSKFLGTMSLYYFPVDVIILHNAFSAPGFF